MDMDKKKRELGRPIVAMFHNSCNLLAALVNKQLFEGSRSWHWVADEVGGMCDYEDCDFLSPEDMVRIIEHHLTYDEYAEWRDANLEKEEYINLRSWLKGARHEMLNNNNDNEDKTSEENR